MFRHLFILIWNKKRQNFLLMSEMLVSFLVVFGLCSLMAHYYQSYRKPLGFDPGQVWAINYNNTLETGNTDSLVQFYESVRQALKAMPQIRELSYASNNYPFSQNTNGTGLRANGVALNSVNNFDVEPGFKEVLGLSVQYGRWFGKGDAVAKDRPVVINESLSKAAFGNRRAVGKYLGNYDDTRRFKVIGVIQDIKTRGDYTDIGNAVFMGIDSGSFRWLGTILVLVTPDADAAFEGRLYKLMAGAMKNANIEIRHLQEERRSRNSAFLTPLFIILIVVGFLVINVALGLFGVLWYNINRRKSEIGLRRALGASGRNISFQLVAESLVLATLSLIGGIFFAIQFLLLKVGDVHPGVYLTGIGMAVLFIYLLVLFCALYPGRQAAAIYPAAALHEE